MVHGKWIFHIKYKRGKIPTINARQRVRATRSAPDFRKHYKIAA